MAHSSSHPRKTSISVCHLLTPFQDFEPDAGASDRADTWDDGWNSIEDSAPPAEESVSYI